MRLMGGAGTELVPLEDVESFLSAEEAEELVALDDALERLRTASPRGADVVTCRFFSGLGVALARAG